MNRDVGNSQLFREFPLLTAMPHSLRTNLSDLLGGQNCEIMLFTILITSSSLFLAISRVIKRCTEEQMGRINARRIITVVENHHLVWYRLFVTQCP